MSVRMDRGQLPMLDPASPEGVFEAVRGLGVRQSVGFGVADDTRSADVERTGERRYVVRTVSHNGTRPMFATRATATCEAAAALVRLALWPLPEDVRAS